MLTSVPDSVVAPFEKKRATVWHDWRTVCNLNRRNVCLDPNARNSYRKDFEQVQAEKRTSGLGKKFQSLVIAQDRWYHIRIISKQYLWWLCIEIGLKKKKNPILASKFDICKYFRAVFHWKPNRNPRDEQSKRSATFANLARVSFKTLGIHPSSSTPVLYSRGDVLVLL